MRKIITVLFVFVFCFCAAHDSLAQDREPAKFRKRNLFIGFGVGLAGYWPSTSHLSDAFTAVEDFYRDQGWGVSGHAAFTTTPLVTYAVRIQFASPIGIMLDTARSLTNDELNAISATLLIDFNRLGNTWLRPYIGAGVTNVSFEFTREYMAKISEDTGSGYRVLDKIVATGNKTGANMIGGVQIEFFRVRICGYGAYWWIPELSDDFGTGVDVTLNLSSFLVGAQLMLTFP